MVRVCFFAAVCFVASTGAVQAGLCAPEGGDEVVTTVEKFARSPSGKPPEVWELCFTQQIQFDERRTKRLLAACELGLEKVPTWGDCVRWSIRMGKRKLGKLDLYDYVERAFPTFDSLDWDSQPPMLYIVLDDERAVPKFVAAWREQLASTKPLSRDQASAWRRFRHGAAEFLGKHGSADERAFLAEQLPRTNSEDDPEVVRAIRAALRAIDARLAARRP